METLNEIKFKSNNTYKEGLQIPKPIIKLFYNKKDVSDIFKPYIKSIIYKDSIENQCDSLDIELMDFDNLFINSWYPRKGDKITCTIELETQVLKCGTFSIDSLNFNITPNQSILEISSIAIPSDVPIRNKNSTFFEKTSLGEIVKFYAEKYKFNLICNAEDNLVLERVAQVNISDLKFLYDLAYKYGYIFKINDHTLSFLKIAENKPIIKLSKSDISSIETNDVLHTFKESGYIEFFNPDKKDLDYIQIGKLEGNIVQIQEKFNSHAEGQAILSTELLRTNKHLKGYLSLAKPKSKLVAGIDFLLSDFGVLNGVYRVTRSVHSISSNQGWQVAAHFEQCQEKIDNINS